jgi:hypothetical protein
MRRRLGTTIATGLILCLLFTIPQPLHSAERHRDKEFAEATDNAALVYLIRQKRFMGKKTTFFVYADNVLLGILDNDCYTYAYVPPGEHLFWLQYASITERIELEPGEVRYFDVWTRFDDVGPEWGQELIDKASAFCTPEEKELAKTEKHVRERLSEAELNAAKEPTKLYWYSRKKSVGAWPHADLAPYSILYIEDLALTDPKADKRDETSRVITAGRRVADLVERQLRDGLFDEVRRESPSEPVAGAVILRGELTQYKPGSRVARGLLIGTSNAHMDFAMHVVDAATGDELATFSAHRVWAWGGFLGMNAGIEEMEEALAYELSVYLEESKTGIEVQPET